MARNHPSQSTGALPDALVYLGARPDQLELAVPHDVTADAVHRLEQGLASQRRARFPLACLDLTGARSFDDATRDRFVPFYRQLMQRSERRAIVADRATVRGAASWVLQVCEDTMARVVHDRRAAHRWLAQSSPRSDQAVGALDAWLEADADLG